MIQRPKRHHLRDYDYSNPGYYFITICTHRDILHRQPHPLGTIHDAEIHLSLAGKVTQQVWEHLPDHYSTLMLDAFCIMPNHIHCILQLTILPDHDASDQTSIRVHPISQIIASFKSYTTREINQLYHTPGQRFWQQNYYDHIIRNERALQAIRNYIIANPYKWNEDQYYSR